MVQVVVNRFQHLVGQQVAQFFPFEVDVAVAAARKIDALEGAGCSGQAVDEGFFIHLAVALHDDGMPRFDLLNAGIVDIEHRLDRRSLGGHHHHFFIVVVIGGADPGGVAHHKRVAVTDQAGQYIAAVEFPAGPLQQALHIQVFVDEVVDLFVGVAVGFEPGMEALHLVVEEVADLFHDGHRIRFFLGVLAQFDQLLEQFVDVGEVEIAGQDEVPVHPVVLPQERVAGLNGIIAVGAVAKVAEEQFAGIRQVFLEPGRIFHFFRRQLFEPPENALEQVVQVIRRIAPPPADVFFTGGYSDLDGRHAGAVLAPVALFLHQQAQLLQPEKGAAVFFLIIIQRF